MSRPLILIFALFLLAACASKTPPDAAPQTTDPATSAQQDLANANVDALLTPRSRNNDYMATESCLKTSDYDRVEVLNGEYLVFHDLGGTTWLNKIKKRCSGLRPKMMLHLGVSKRQICVGGMFEGVQNFAGTIETMTASCYLGVFEPISKDQLQAIKTFLGVR